MANYCMHCGSLLPQGANHCKACGRRITKLMPASHMPLPAEQRAKHLRRRKTVLVLLAVLAVILLCAAIVVFAPMLAAAIVGLIILAPLCLIFDVSNDTFEKRINGKTYVISGSHSDRKRTAENSRRCNGDCEHCPPHYGNRYGRRYYGKGHNSGCERGGNGGPGPHREV